jgi:hypothetical protein
MVLKTGWNFSTNGIAYGVLFLTLRIPTWNNGTYFTMIEMKIEKQ